MAIKLTLLQLVTDMLGAIDAENVTLVTDTEEAEMCVAIANRGFEQMIGPSIRWRHLRKTTVLTATGNLSEMTLPTGTIAFDPYSLYYSGKIIPWVEPDVFLWRTETRTVDGSATVAINLNKIDVGDDPSFFTSFDDLTLTFDTIPDNTTGLVGANTKGICYVAPTSRLSTSAEVFNLPAVAFPALSHWCIGTAIAELKGDSQGAQWNFRQYKAAMASLSRNRRLVDNRSDSRKWIIPRTTLLRTY